MSPLATDRSLPKEDLALLVAVAEGDRDAIHALCHRFQVPVLALLVKQIGDLELASSRVPQILESVCDELVNGRLAPDRFVVRMEETVLAVAVLREELEEELAGATGLGAIPRVVRRRVIRKTLPTMELPELLTLLMFYLGKSPIAEMIGLVDDSQSKVQERFANAHQLLTNAIQAAIRSE